MAKFYVHFRNGDQVAIDDEGVDLPDVEAAKDLAIKSAREIVAEAIKHGYSTILDAVVITDEAGKDLMTIPATDVLPKSLRAG
jgi:hypothetical protein